MNILILGGGGREDVLAWKLSLSPMTGQLFAIPGNPGVARFAKCIPEVNPNDNKAVVKKALELKVDLVVVGPEAPLVNAIVDDLAEVGIDAFGPTYQAAQLEGSKVYAKKIMKKYGIPTARYEVFSDIGRARAYVRQMRRPFAVKADGLASGKGVILAHTVEDALAAIDTIMVQKAFGAAGNNVVIEEMLEGEEASVLCFTDGEHILPMLPAQDHKRALFGDKGPNTGGMGAYAPAPVVTPELMAEIQATILEPTIRAMQNEGRPYKGCLYAGLMITKDGPKVIEFNARFGDPETQVVLPLLKNDLVDLMQACLDGTLFERKLEWKDGAATCVVMASEGYPGAYESGKPITGIEAAEALGALVFHAGTARAADGALVNHGGRVLDVVGWGTNIEGAVAQAYAAVEKINFDNAYYRLDIAHRALERHQPQPPDTGA